MIRLAPNAMTVSIAVGSTPQKWIAKIYTSIVMIKGKTATSELPTPTAMWTKTATCISIPFMAVILLFPKGR